MRYWNNKRDIIMPLFLAAAIILGIFIGYYFSGNNLKQNLLNMAGRRSADTKLSYTMNLINQYYIDSVNLDTLTEKIMPLLFHQLDPHSSYIPAQSLQAVLEPLQGEFDGIGVMFNMATDTIVISNVIPSGPSDRAGLISGDRIITIDDSLVAGRNIPQDNILKMLRGKRGTTVELGVQRQGVQGLMPFTVTRDKIDVKSINTALILTDDIGYIRLSAFSKTSHVELVAAIENLKKSGMKNLILDLRGNSGGFLDQAVYLANEFLPKDELIVYTMGRSGKVLEEYRSEGKGRFTTGGLAIIVDERSASSSEILAGAVQDNDRGVIIGRRSFGKGLVQQQIPYNDGSAVRLTIARYYTPAGRSIQRPYQNGDDDYYNDLAYRFMHDELFNADSIRFADSLKYQTTGGRIVYGGGGIMPDIFVPLDTSYYNKYYIDIYSKNLMFRYALNYTDRHREVLNGITTIREINEFLDRDRGLLNDFVAYASSNGVKPDWRQIEQSRAVITSTIRAFIARNTPLDENGYTAQIFPTDNPIMRAIEYFQSPREKLPSFAEQE